MHHICSTAVFCSFNILWDFEKYRNKGKLMLTSSVIDTFSLCEGFSGLIKSWNWILIKAQQG